MFKFSIRIRIIPRRGNTIYIMPPYYGMAGELDRFMK
jgi:hypothetical protein